MPISIARKINVASLDVHPQKTFTEKCPGELPVPEGHTIAHELNAQAKLAGFRIGAKEAHHPNSIWVATPQAPQLTPIAGENVDVRWVIHSVPGTLGFDLIDGLPKITDYDFFVWEGIELDMHPYGACYHDHAEKLSTGIIEFLRINQITTVIVGGLATDYCVKVTVLQLLKAGFTVIVNLGACRGITPATTEQAIFAMQNAGAIIVESAAEICNEAENLQ